MFILWRKYSRDLFTTVAVWQEKLQLIGRLGLLVEQRCLTRFDPCNGVFGSSRKIRDGIDVHIHYIYLIFPSVCVQNCWSPLEISVDNIHMRIADPQSTRKDRKWTLLNWCWNFGTNPPFWIWKHVVIATNFEYFIWRQ